ncbi:hypothetical protein BDB01DRAFT_896867 [Pilobolus umbonatus]|nr:hypothetical protein BDB01DRAFT_896867 [Pilobolus umbonatus]
MAHDMLERHLQKTGMSIHRHISTSISSDEMKGRQFHSYMGQICTEKNVSPPISGDREKTPFQQGIEKTHSPSELSSPDARRNLYQQISKKKDGHIWISPLWVLISPSDTMALFSYLSSPHDSIVAHPSDDNNLCYAHISVGAFHFPITCLTYSWLPQAATVNIHNHTLTK